MHVQSFEPLASAHATRLILGTMPGRASLLAGEYYAHPRNAFWFIVQELFGISRELTYAQRVRRLTGARVAVWDVLAACTRTTSLDSDIVAESIVPNDLAGFLTRHDHITSIFFNGATARALFERHVLRELAPEHQRMARIQLPSTSPANARLSAADKARAWRVIAD